MKLHLSIPSLPAAALAAGMRTLRIGIPAISTAAR